MAFASGPVSFRRYLVQGSASQQIEQEMLDKLETHALRGREMGVPEEIEYGWSGGRHVLDASFSFEHNVFAEAISFGLRVDTNKVPGELKTAYTLMEEEAAAAGNPSGFISKLQKRDVKDIVRRKMEDELRSGKYRRSKLSAVLWDLPTQTLFCAVSASTEEKLLELFERTFGMQLLPISSGSLALRVMEGRGRRRDYEDLRPTRFAPGPEGESQVPDYPWVAKGPEAKDFLGNEFLLWLWHEAEARNGSIGKASVFIDRLLELDCAYGQTGRDALRADGPARMPEAVDGLQSGKVPRRAGLVMDADGLQFNFNLNAETLAVGALKLPEVEEADTPRVLFEERIAMLRNFCKAMDGMFEAFLKVRTGGAWEGEAGTIRRWIQRSGKRAVAAVAVA
jgi:hypothetical protein